MDGSRARRRLRNALPDDASTRALLAALPKLTAADRTKLATLAAQMLIESRSLKR